LTHRLPSPGGRGHFFVGLFISGLRKDMLTIAVEALSVRLFWPFYHPPLITLKT